MTWEAITAMATSLTVLAVIGGAIMMHLLTKPNVSILSLSPIHWFYIFEGGSKVIGTGISMNIRLVNSGKETTVISGGFATSDDKLFTINEQIKLEGHGSIIDTVICLDSPDVIAHGVTLKGCLFLEPWGNRRLCIGKKYLRNQVEVSEDEYNKGKG